MRACLEDAGVGVRRVLGTSTIDGALHLVMPLAELGSLARRLRELRTGLPVGELVDVAEQMLEGLESLHSAGLVHCDVKPHNLLLDRRGTVLLGDFGLAKISQERASMAVREHVMAKGRDACGKRHGSVHVRRCYAMPHHGPTPAAPHPEDDAAGSLGHVRVYEPRAIRPDEGDHAPVGRVLGGGHAVAPRDGA